MTYLLDTNVVSELMKAPGEPAAVRWMSKQDPATLNLSVVTILELRRGVQVLPAGNRRQTLDRWLSEDLPVQFAGRILEIDHTTADIGGRLFGDRRLEPTIRRTLDFLLAATALRHGLTIVTRNERDFRDLGVDVVNPWSV